MKQRLQFEQAWDKTISTQDRQKIEQSFNVFTESLPASGIHFSPLWKTKNHQGSLLMTVLVHNCNTEPFILDSRILQYRLEDRILARHAFDYSFKIQGRTSMPWTFIFPEGKYTEQASHIKGKLEIIANLV